MAESVQAAPTGKQIVPANFNQTFQRDGNGYLTQISFVDNGVTYVRNFTRDENGNVTAISHWMVQ